MSTITTTMLWVTDASASRWDQFKFRFSGWRQRARSRRELEGLDDSTLRDIGITHFDVHREVNKPFWKA